MWNGLEIIFWTCSRHKWWTLFHRQRPAAEPGFALEKGTGQWRDVSWSVLKVWKASSVMITWLFFKLILAVCYLRAEFFLPAGLKGMPELPEYQRKSASSTVHWVTFGLSSSFSSLGEYRCLFSILLCCALTNAGLIYKIASSHPSSPVTTVPQIQHCWDSA